jgi:hypothetical protein
MPEPDTVCFVNTSRKVPRLDPTTGRIAVRKLDAEPLCTFLTACDVDARVRVSREEVRYIQLSAEPDTERVEALIRFWHITT